MIQVNHISKKIIKILLSVLLIVSTCLNIYNVGFNGHFHKTLSGEIVLHFHPYSNNAGDAPTSPFKNHTHSDVDFFHVMMQNITMTLLPILFAAILLLVYKRVYRYFIPHIEHLSSTNIHADSALRAPPIFA